jgi:hypothetical protein
LDPGEQAEADEGYAGHPDKVKCPANAVTQEEKRGMQARVWAHHETLNGCLKNWGILSQVFCQNILRHGYVFRASMVKTRLTIEHGEPPFPMDYKD